ncbi:MAG TPA: TraR/DksA C4-type zinc finger protein [Patescibacteria group bacterium]
MNKKTLNLIKEKLLKEKARLAKELGQFASESKKVKHDYDADFPDMGDKEDENALEVAAYGDRLTLERTLEKKLQDVVSALEKIEKGQYGVCKYCGQEIDEKRLLARPESGACVSCKAELQSRPKIV